MSEDELNALPPYAMLLCSNNSYAIKRPELDYRRCALFYFIVLDDNMKYDSSYSKKPASEVKDCSPRVPNSTQQKDMVRRAVVIRNTDTYNLPPIDINKLI